MFDLHYAQSESAFLGSLCQSLNYSLFGASARCIVSISGPVSFLRGEYIPLVAQQRRASATQRYRREIGYQCVYVSPLFPVPVWLPPRDRGQNKPCQLLLSPKSNFSNITAPVGTHTFEGVCAFVPLGLACYCTQYCMFMCAQSTVFRGNKMTDMSNSNTSPVTLVHLVVWQS